MLAFQLRMMALFNIIRRYKSPVLMYSGLILVTVVLLIVSFRLTFERLTIPFSYHIDTLWYLMHFRTMLETGWYTDNLRVGAPEGMHIHDFPMADTLHFVLIKALIMLAQNYIVGLNLYLLLTFILTAVFSYAALVRLDAHPGAAFVGALLYAFQPYHFRQNIEHIFLSGYYLVPFFTLAALQISSGKAALITRSEGRFRLAPDRHDLILFVALGAAIGSSGVYYAFFSAFFLGVVILVALLHGRPERALTAGFFALVITVAMCLNFLPSVVFWLEHGANQMAVSRHSVQTSMYSLNLSQMLAPSSDHGIEFLSNLRHELSLHLGAGGHMEYIGLCAAVGVCVLLLHIFKADKDSEQGWNMHVLALFLVSALLFAMTGGFGSLFSITITASLRALERICIFLAFFGTIAWVVPLSRWLNRPDRSFSYRAVGATLLVLILLFGLGDQVSKSFVPRYEAIAAKRASDRALVGSMEKTLPKGSMIFQLPYCDFPEPDHCARHQMEAYDNFRAYLVSDHLRWSSGAVKGRAGARWQTEVTKQAPSVLVAEIRRKGFVGLHVDLGAYPENGTAIARELEAATGRKALRSPDGRFAFFDAR